MSVLRSQKSVPSPHPHRTQICPTQGISGHKLSADARTYDGNPLLSTNAPAF